MLAANFIITVSVDVLAPKGGKPPAGTVVTKKLDTYRSFCY